MSQVVNLYSIFDVKVESYVCPYPAIDNNSATVLLGKLITSDLSPFYEKAADVLLFLVGSFDDSTGSLVACQPKLITTGFKALEYCLEEGLIDPSDLEPSMPPAAPSFDDRPDLAKLAEELGLSKAAEAKEKVSLAGAASPSSSEDGNKCSSAGTAEDCSHDGAEKGLSN